MNKDSPYYKQVSLLIRMLPVVATEPVFALKGGTAINPRPIHEVMAPNWQPLSEVFKTEFDGMTFERVEFEDLVAVRPEMLLALQKHFTKRDYAFLMSFKNGHPDWTLFDYPSAADLPAIRWKLQNINKLAKNQAKHAGQLEKLKQVLDGWLLCGQR